MRFVTLSLVTLFLFMTWNTDARKRNKACYSAKTCIHNGDEKCGVDKKGKVRRFYDSCDILEYNCLYNTTYVKTKQHSCQKLPPIESKRHMK